MFIRITLVLIFATTTLTSPLLQHGTPSSVGLLEQPYKDLVSNITGYLQAANYGAATFQEIHPMYAGATVLVGHQNTVVSHFAVGESLKYADSNGTELPMQQRINATKNTIYDMASLTKLFTTVVAMQQLEKGNIALNETVATYLPDFSTNGKENVTILQLFTHTSGFDADPSPDLWDGYTTYFERRNAIVEQKLLNIPGTTYLYSDLNYMSMQLVLEAVTNTELDVLMHDDFTGPLGMSESFFNRGNIDFPRYYARMAATEFQVEVLGVSEPDRPQPVRGTVHDENAWSLNGVAGHAGMFSTAKDLAIFCQMILNNGTYGDKQILKPATVDLIFHNYNAQFPTNAHGLGFELNQTYWSGPMRSIQTAGHTGYTGTTMVIDRPTNTFFIFLCNRVHPSRLWSNPNVVREMLGYFVAKSLGRNVTDTTA